MRRWMAGSLKMVALGVVVCVAGAVSVSGAGANPVVEFVAPSRDPASVMPTPLGDPFYDPPPGFEKQAPGTVLASRPGGTGVNVRPVTSTELLLRSTDAKGNPVAVVATLLVPQEAWTGPGTRPVVSYNLAIDSLGNTCTPSYRLKVGTTNDLILAQVPLVRNYAVLFPDHQGPRQAYSAGLMAGHAALDSLRAVLNTPELGLQPDAPAALQGYSGGAIAAGWAAQLAPTYAPEINLVGATVGGVPADFSMLLETMNGRNLASGIFLAATLGLAREYPELMTLFNDNGWRLAQFGKDMCSSEASLLGAIAPIPVELLTDTPNPAELPMVKAIIAENRLGAKAPAVPMFLYHGEHEFWIPLEGANNLYEDWCRRGVDVQYEVFPGEHIIVAVLGALAAGRWIDLRFAGKPAPTGCFKS